MNKKQKPKSGKPGARQIAFRALWRVEAQDAYSDIVLDKLYKQHKIPEKERALATELTYGVLRWQLLLDHYLRLVTDRPLAKIERQALIALRLGAYQIMKLDRIPAPAAVNESVSLAPPRARGFVNAVLRSLASKKDRLKGPETIDDGLKRIAVTHSHPRWLVKEWAERLGKESTAELCSANNQRPPLTLRVNTMRTGRGAFLRLLEAEGIKAEPGRWSPLAVVILKHMPVPDIPGYDEGLFAVQDEASQLVPLVLAPRPHETILDTCAAPGTKSLEIMQLMGGKGRVIAVDVHAGRLKRMAKETQRLGLKNVTRVVSDATGEIEFPERLKGAVFDRILVDAPCTGLGTIRRNPEIKWKRKKGHIKARANLQRAILENTAKMLKPGGVLVYSTCTFTTEENEWAIAPLLHSDNFILEDPGKAGPQIKSSLASLVENKMLRTWPHLTGTDGFTIFKLKKEK